MNYKLQTKKGFTLLEIVIVVSIIAMLAATLLPKLINVRSPANDTKRIVDLRAIQNYLELYYQINRSYPNPLVKNVGYGNDTDTINCPSNSLCYILTTAKITNSLPKPPTSGESYQYASDASMQSFVLMATLQQKNNPVLNDDADGTINSIDCADPNYCTQF